MPLSRRPRSRSWPSPYGVDAGELYRKTAGNPFFVVEVLAAGVDAMPDTVTDAISARTARLDPSARQLLEGGLDRPATRGALAPGEACPGGDRRSRRVPDVGHAHVRALKESPSGMSSCASPSRSRLPPTDRIELHRRALAVLTDPPGGERDLARVALPRRGGGRCRRGGSLRTCGGSGCGVARRASRGGGPVRTGTSIRRSARGGRTVGAPRGSLPRVLPDRSVQRRNRRARAGARHAAGRWATRSRRATRCVAFQSSSGVRAGLRNPSAAPATRSRCSKPCRRAANSPGRTPTSQ